tara:strand:- start:746 stop:2284 length:1539 start_codon:yes stop_codon:yes gene_type:complete
LKFLITLVLLLPWLRGGNLSGNPNYIVFGAIAICILYIAVRSEVKAKKWKLFSGITFYIFLCILLLFNNIIVSENKISKAEFTNIDLDASDEKINHLKKIVINYNDEFNQNKANALYLLNNSINEITYKFNEINEAVTIIANKLIADQSNIYSPFIPNSILLSKTNFIDFTIIYLSIFLFLFLKRGKYNFRLYSKLILINCATLSVIGILMKFDVIWFYDIDKTLNLLDIPDSRNYFSSFAYKNHWAAFCILCIAHGIALFLSKYKRNEDLNKKTLFFFTLTSFTIISTFFVIGSRSSLLVLIILFVCVYILFSSRKNILIVVGILSIALLSMIKSDLYKSNVFIQTHMQFEHFKNGNSPLRLLLWSDCLKLISDKTFFGYGTNSYKVLNPIFHSQATVSSRYLVTENAHHEFTPVIKTAHSDLLQSLAEFGFITFALVIFPLCFYFLRLFTTSRSYYVRTLCIGCLMHLVYSIIDLPNKSLANYMLFIFTLITIICYSRVSMIAPRVKISS